MDLDVTLFVQFAILAILVALLNRLLFAPLLRVIDSRHQKTHGARDEAARLEQLSAADRSAYDAQMAAARRAAQAERETLRGSGRDEARRIIAAMRTKISQATHAAREEVAANEWAVGLQLEAEVGGLARQLVAKLLGREVAK